MNQNHTGFSPESLRLIGAALALHHVEGIAASITPIPSTGRFVATGTPAEVARLLEIAPASALPNDADLLQALQNAARLLRAAGFAMNGTCSSKIVEAINKHASAQPVAAAPADDGDAFAAAIESGRLVWNFGAPAREIAFAGFKAGRTTPAAPVAAAPAARQIMFAAYSRCIVDDRLSPDQIADVLLSAAPAAPVAQATTASASNIKTWRERLPKGAGLSYDYAHVCAMKAEIDELRTAFAQQGAPQRCEHCDGTGDVHRADGEWAGTCTCPAGASQGQAGEDDAKGGAV